MTNVRKLALSALLTLACGTTLALAQTGPVTQPPISGGPTAPGNPTGPGTTNPAPNNGLTPESLAAYLKTQGYEVAGIRTHEGGSNKVVDVIIRKDDWTYKVEFEFAGNTIWLVAPLGSPGPNFNQMKLVDLLRSNHKIGPTHFSYRNADNRVCMNIDMSVRSTTAQVQRNLEDFLKNIRETHPVWSNLI
jgi:hypothetical protein